ncbi:MAG: VWA domain-containing protein [Acidobacteria bacterium]|nr:MAG: VWA domain-containing protein [Acidobacteriota bacterium]
MLALVGAGPAVVRDDGAGPEPAAIRILPLERSVAAGPTKVETLLIDPAIVRVRFLLDGEVQAQRRHPPFDAKLPFAQPPREQRLEVEAYAAGGELVGRDVLVVNRHDPPFAVRLTGLDAAAGGLLARAEVSVPRGAALEEVVFELNGTPIARLTEGPFEARIPLSRPATTADFVRLEARLADGRRLEDVATVVDRPGLSERIEVNLVELQTLVTVRRTGQVVTGLEADDFDLRQRGKPQRIARLYRAGDVSLSFGLVLDSSGSMAPIWQRTLDAARELLSGTMSPRDRAFLVDFNTRLRLAQPLTGDFEALSHSLEEIEPSGGTALFDSILFGLLQLVDAPGRRALVVVTDGVDSASKADPDRIAGIARRLGVPIYVVALAQPGRSAEVTTTVHALKLITDPTGGRLLRVGRLSLEHAFARIGAELRNQYLLTYYAAEPPGDDPEAVSVRIKGRKDLEVRTVRGGG